MHRTRKAGYLVALLGTFVLGGFIFPKAADLSGPKLFNDVMELVTKRYVDSLDSTALYEKAARGLVEQLDDPYAELYNPKELEQFTVQAEGHYGGVGMLVEDQNGVTVVSRVFPNTPAEHGGVQVGDRIVSIDDQATRGWTLTKVASTLKGKPGTLVRVRFQRPGAGDPIDSRFTRAVIRIPAVPYATMLNESTGYIPLLQFNETSAEETATSIQKLVGQGAKSLVLDLRGNGGGLVNEAVEIAGLFVPRGTVVASQRERERELGYTTPNQPLALNIPLVVLVDGGSASASEIVAGALQDHDRAVVIGTGTFGKGLVQSAYRLDGGYLLKLTTGKWFTPSGRTIHRERKLVDGRLVEDSTALQDTTRAGKPVYRSDAGRTLFGGGGITPDLMIKQDTLSAAEQDFLKTVQAKSQDVYLSIYDLAFELKGSVKPDFTVKPEWRNDLYKRITARGVEVERAKFDAASRYIDILLSDRLARLAFGEAAAKVRAIDNDTQLVKALDLLHNGRTQKELFTQVARVGQK